MQENYPKFIKSTPEGKDLFDGQSHDKVAEMLHEVIISDSLENHIIGLEGEWGSGKSNVIEILKIKFEEDEKKYHFFTYDTWGHQEDLTRRSFLEELIEELLTKGYLKNNNDKWKNLEAQLLARKSTKHINKYPLIKRFWILFMGSFLLFALNTIIYEDFFENQDFFEIYIGLWKPFLVKYLISFALFVWGIYELKKEYSNLNEEVDDVTREKLTFWKKVERLAYWFNGKDLTSKEVENIIDDEPSVKRFKEYFKEIVNDLDTEKIDGLILVFDNIDRVSADNKVMSLWSSIHTFFSETNYPDVWTLIPYDKNHLANFFHKEESKKGLEIVNEFINKTFAISFRISPPVISDWKSFFHLKLNEAFGEKFFEEKNLIEEKYYLETIFDYSVTTNINPRQIITYINAIVTLYKQWGEKIKLRYLATFIIVKQDILINPIEKISSNSYLRNLDSLFLEDDNIQKNMAALVFNVELEKSDEVLLKRTIEQIFINRDIKSLEEIKSHQAFLQYFDKVFKERVNSSSTIIDKIAIILTECKDIIGKNQFDNYWLKITHEVESKMINEGQYHKDFLDIHKLILTNASEISKKPKEILKYLLKSNKSFYTPDPNGITQIDHAYVLEEIDNFIKLEKINININEIISETVLIPADLISIIERDNDLNNLKIISRKRDITEYLQLNDFGVLKFFHNLSILEILVSTYKKDFFNELLREINDRLIIISYDENDIIPVLLKAQMILEKDKPIKKTLPFETAKNHLEIGYVVDGDIYFPQIINILISYQFSNNLQSTKFLEILNDEVLDVKKFASTIEYYISYIDILKLAIDHGHTNNLIIEIIKDLSKNIYGTGILDASWVFKNFEKINSIIYDGNIPIEFLVNIDRWKKFFSKDINSENIFEEVDETIFFYDTNNQSLKCIDFLNELALENFKNMTSDDYIKMFNSDSKKCRIFKQLYLKEKIDNKITKSQKFMNAYESYLFSIIEGSVLKYDVEFWNQILVDERIDVKSLKRIFNTVLDKLLYVNHSISNEEILFFEKGLFYYATNLLSYSSEVKRKIIIPMFKNCKLFKDVLINNKKSIFKIIDGSDDYIHDIEEILDANIDDLPEHLYDELVNCTKIGKKNKS